MKIVIDIPDEEYEDVKKANGCYYDFGKAIVYGIPLPNNATNGDVIKALFPDAGQPHFYGVKNGCFDADWWNAPYKSESDKSADTFEKLLNSGFYERFRKEAEND